MKPILKRLVLVAGIISLCAVILVGGMLTAHAAGKSGSNVTQAAVPGGNARFPAKSHLQQNQQWMALKLAYKVRVPLTSHIFKEHPVLCNAAAPLERVSPLCGGPPPPSTELNTSVVTHTIEPYGNIPPNPNACTGDDTHYCYVDLYFWDFCGPGAVDNALYYWNGLTNSYPSRQYTEPSYAPYHSHTTWWSDYDNRGYLMYIAMDTQPPSFPTPGLPTFGAYYPGSHANAGTVINDVRDVMNWEASGHSSNWANYFYITQSDVGVTASTIHAEITRDIAQGAPVVAEVNTTNLPNWNQKGIIHYITIIGYDDTKGIYYYTDTCGTGCGSNSSGGIHTINQSKPDQYGKDLYDAIVHVGGGGGIVW